MKILKEYIAPEMEIIEIDDTDIIITSNGGDWGGLFPSNARTTDDSKF